MAKIRVVRPFTFSSPGVPGDKPGDPLKKLATERKFDVGVHDIDDSIASHPWIKAGADGSIADPKTADTIESATQAVVDAKSALAAAESDLATAQKVAADKAASSAGKPAAAAGATDKKV